MKSLNPVFWSLVALLFLASDPAAETLHRENGSHPSQSIRFWHLKEEWRAGPEGEGFLFGRIQDVAVDPAGNTCLLDYQQQTTYVFDPAGKFHSALGRLGDGPGETVRASCLLMDEGRLGLLNRYPAEIVWFDAEGDPGGALTPVLPETPEAVLGSWYARLRHRGVFVALSASSFDEGGVTSVHRIGECLSDGTVTNISVEFGPDLYTHGSEDDKVDESRYFNPLEGRWDVDRHGRTWVAPRRDDYLLEVHEPTGDLALTATRDFEQPTRSIQQIKIIRRSLEDQWTNTNTPISVGDRSPCISKLWIMENPWGDEVWLETAASFHDLPPGVMVRYDLFNLDGEFTHQVDIVGEGDPLFDRWYLVGKNRLVMVRNASSGGYSEDDADNPRFDDEALEVISYRIVWEE